MELVHGCMYFDESCPVNICYACEEEKKQKAAQEKVDKQRDLLNEQINLPDGHPKKIFSDAEIWNPRAVQADKNGRNRILLRDLRAALGVVG